MSISASQYIGDSVISEDMADEKMDDLPSQLAHRDNYRRKIDLQKTPRERMAAMARLQKRMWATLRSSPEGYAHFMRRNFKKRAIDVPESDAR